MALPGPNSLVSAGDFQGNAISLDSQVLVYQQVSGSVQLVDMLGYEILTLVAERARSVQQLVELLEQQFDISEIEDLESAILNVISQFQAVDLIELEA